ncbi:hypothetical protein [Anaeroselena agilis]|uniref:Uncharacterized protein n=1 Tax=Anaeroselena agilis TaxID=3063788 RepID=A0ABU3P334_9FIRM|nr:hypothetical protein [Selenomonadales bacterium 4137-cl]
MLKKIGASFIVTVAVVALSAAVALANPQEICPQGFMIGEQNMLDAGMYVETSFRATRPNNVPNRQFYQGLETTELEYFHRGYKDPFYRTGNKRYTEEAEQDVGERGQRSEARTIAFMEREPFSGGTVYWWKITHQHGAGLGRDVAPVVTYDAWFVAEEKMRVLSIKISGAYASQPQIREWLEQMVARTR